MSVRVYVVVFVALTDVPWALLSSWKTSVTVTESLTTVVGCPTTTFAEPDADIGTPLTLKAAVAVFFAPFAGGTLPRSQA